MCLKVTLVVAALLAAVEVGGGAEVAPPPHATSRSTASKLNRANKLLFRLMKERVSITTPFWGVRPLAGSPAALFRSCSRIYAARRLPGVLKARVSLSTFHDIKRISACLFIMLHTIRLRHAF